MTTKKYFQQAFHLDQLIQTNKEELERLRELSVSVQSMQITGDRIQSSTPTDKIGNIVARIIDLEADIQTDIDRYIKVKTEILNVVRAVEDERLKLILQKRYINFKKFEDIAAEMDYDVRWVYILHGDALKAAEKHIIEHHG